MRAQRRMTALWAGVVVALLGSGPALAQSLEIVTIVDDTTPIPDGQGTFGAFFSAPRVRGSVIAFLGNGTGFQGGVYQSVDGHLSRIVNRTSPRPDGQGTFANAGFSQVSVGQNGVAFAASVPFASTTIYLYSGGSLSRVAEGTDPWLDNGQVAFRTGSAISLARNGTIELLADTSTLIPGGTGTFEWLGPPRLDDGRVAFYGSNATRSGFYIVRPGEPPEVLVDTETLIPGTAQSFGTFRPESLTIEGPDLAFSGGLDYPGEGLYLLREGSLETIADQSTALPFSSTPLVVVSASSLDLGRAAFLAVSGSRGIYATAGHTFEKVFDQSDTPGGNEVYSLDMGPQALSQNRVAWASRIGGVGGAIYMATLPPVTLCTATLEPRPDGAAIRYEVATGEAVTWTAWLSYQDQTVPLWSLPLPMLDRPYRGEVALPGVLAVGELGLVSSFTKEPDGIVCSDWHTLDTGLPEDPTEAPEATR